LWYHLLIKPSLDSQDPNPELALKILRNRRDPSFTNERSVLQVLRKLRHDHIVRLLCTYKHNDTYNMLFPLAECNLRGFIGSRPPNPSKEASVWLLSQLVGLSEALRIIHNYRSSSEDGGNTNRHGSVQTIYHHDLKPENILYFPPADAIESLGNFQIADFGLAKINRIQPSSSSAGTSTSGTATYAPPESDSNPIKLGRRYDIWSMGCIFLELLVWFCYGPDGCREFNESRRLPDNAPYHDDGFFVTRDGKASLRPGVTEWIEKLRAHQSCRERGSLGTTVTLVEGEMLEVNPEKRMKSNRCTKRLKYFLEEMEKERRDPLRSGNPVGSSPSEEYHNAGGSAETPQPFFTGGGAPALVLPEDDPEAPGNIAAAAEFPLSPVQQTEPHRDLLSAPRPSGRLGRLRSTTF
jgi:serine/threonine protein kinase